MKLDKYFDMMPVVNPQKKSRREMTFRKASVFDDSVLECPQANWIWNKASEPNSYQVFRKKFIIYDTLPPAAEAVIAADSKYTLWINGETVVFEGGLKRGPTPEDTFADVVDIASYLKKGMNIVCLQVRYFGRDGYSHVDSGQGGLLFSCSEINLFSDNSWLVNENSAFFHEQDNPFMPNYRLAESNICYDAGDDMGDFFMLEYDDSFWKQAKIVAEAGNAPFGRLIRRITPQFRDCGLKDFSGSGFPESKRSLFERQLVLELPYNAQITPYLDISAPAGKEINIYTDRYVDKNGFNIRVKYITRSGSQQFESPGWMNGQKVIFEIPSGVKINALKYRETGYNADFSGIFRSGDEMLNTLWEKSRRTLYLTMRDTFFDCPDRERAQWWGDAVNEAELCYYSLSRESHLLIKSGILTMAGWQHADGAMQTVVPDRIDCFELPLQNLAGITGFWSYYLYTADRDTLEKIYDPAKSYLLLWEMGADGLVQHRRGSWDWPDWGSGADMPVLENAWYYYALSAFISISDTIGAECGFAKERADSIKASFSSFFNGRFYSSGDSADDRANAMAVISGLAPKECYEALKEVLVSVENSSPYMEKYVLEALCKMGFYNEAVTRMKKRYKEMAESGCTTLWEFWNQSEGTSNHAWTGGPLLIMSKYLAGIRPLEAGYKYYTVAPRPAGLKSIYCEVPTPHGDIKLSYIKNDEASTVNIEAVRGAVAVISLPYSSGSQVFINGIKAELTKGAVTENTAFLKTDSNSIFFLAGGGTYTFVIKSKTDSNM